MSNFLGGFSPRNALAQVMSPTSDQDVFTNWSVRGGERSPASGGLVGAQTGPAPVEGTTYYDTNSGMIKTFRNGVWHNTPIGTADARQQIANSQTLRLGNSVLGINTTGGTGGGGGGASAGDLALFDQSISQYQNALNQLGRQQGVGLENVQNAYQQQLNRLLQGRTTAEGKLNDQREQTTQDNVRARSGIDANVGRTMNSLQRLLGARGAGASSAAQIAAPTAAATMGTQQQGEVADAFAKNMGGLDQSWKDYEREWQYGRDDLGQQRNQQRQQVLQSTAQQRQQINQQLAQVQAQRAAAQGMTAQQALAAGQPYLNAANALSPQITDFGRQFGQNISAKTPTYNSPDFAQYDYRQFGGPNVQPGAGANAGQYLNMIPGQRREEERRR